MSPDGSEPARVTTWRDRPDREPAHARVEGVDLVAVRDDDAVSVLTWHCLHRGVLLGDGYLHGHELIRGVHGWEYRYDTGVSEYDNSDVLETFTAWIDVAEDSVLVAAAAVAAWADENPQPNEEPDEANNIANPEVYGEPDPENEPHTHSMQDRAQHGPDGIGEHGRVSAMCVPRSERPSLDELQLVTAQLARTPLDDDAPVDTELVIGPKAENPLRLDMHAFASHMRFGAGSEEANIAIAKGADLAGTGVCSGEGGMLPEEREANARYLYEYATGTFGWDIDLVDRVQALHFKAAQMANTGTGGHLPGEKVQGRIADVRDLEPGTDAVSPARFPELRTPDDFAELAAVVRDVGDGIPIGFKLSAQHVEHDIDFTLEAGADYLILDGRGGVTGAAPDVFTDPISVPTMAGLARARRHLDARGQSDVTDVATGSPRAESDVIKAMALGADGVAVAISAMQAIGCLGMRAYDPNDCPVGIATRREDRRNRLLIDAAADGLQRFFEASVQLMQVIARACGHDRFSGFERRDPTTWQKDIADLTGVAYVGVGTHR